MNDENIIILGDLDSTDEDSKQKQRELAQYAMAEIDRMIGAYA